MSVKMPIRVEKLFELRHVGIKQRTYIGPSSVTMESEKFICVRERIDSESMQAVMIDMTNPYAPMKRRITADSVIMNPTSKIIALRGRRTLEIASIEAKKSMKTHQMNEDPVFWKWISADTIGLVTSAACYHWSLEGDSEPQKMFDRHDDLAGFVIADYRTDAASKWLVVIGTANREGGVAGLMQLYSVERGISQQIEGHAACFVQYKMENNPQPSTLFCYSVRTEDGGKLRIIEIGHLPAGNTPFPKKIVDLFPPGAQNYLPVSMQANGQYGIIYVIMKYGTIHVFDIETGTGLCMNSAEGGEVFATTLCDQKEGIIIMNKQGEVIRVSIDKSGMVSFVSIEHPDLALSLARRWNSLGDRILLSSNGHP